MSIASILSNKGADVFRVAPGMLIRAAVQILGERGIGAVLVMDGPGDRSTGGGPDRLLGILSERDIVRAMARDGAAVLELAVSDLMTQVLHTISPTASIADAMRIMTEQRVRHLPVIEDEALVGLVSIGDIVKARLGEQANEVESLRAYVGGVH